MSGLPPGWTKVNAEQVRSPQGELFTQKIPPAWTIDKATKKVTDPSGTQYGSLLELIYGIRRWEQERGIGPGAGGKQ